MWKTMNYLRKKKPEVSVLRGLRAGFYSLLCCLEHYFAHVALLACFYAQHVHAGLECWDVETVRW